MKQLRSLAPLFIGLLVVRSAIAADSMPSAATPGRPDLFGLRFTQTTGPALYEAICQGCHMSNGAGAKGAAAYPALASNARLAAKGFPIMRVLEGSKAMPPLKGVLNDEQIAAVVTYVRTHFGNTYADMVSTGDVKALRKQ
jgi:mono/diheme cytochrome c family protein